MGPIIDLTNLFPWRIILLFAYSVAFFNIYRAILKDKFHPIITFIAIFAARIITSIAFINNDNLNVLGYPVFGLLYFIILIFLTDGKLYDKFLAVLILFITQFVGTSINAMICTVAFQGQTHQDMFGEANLNLEYLTQYLSSCIITVITGILLGSLLKLYKLRRAKKHNSMLLIYMSIYPLSHILIVLIPLSAIPLELDENYLGTGTYIAITILFAVIMILDCSFPLIINHFEKILEQNTNYEKELLKNTLDYQQMIMLKEEKAEFRKIKHDFANITTTAKGFIEIGKPEKALEILNRTNDDFSELAGFSICMNETINTIIYIKQNQAKKNNINLLAEINETAFVKIDDYDLCRLLHNIIDNSLNAADLLHKNRECKVNIEINSDRITIESENEFNTIKSNKKKKSEEHGNGIGIIKETLKKYNGEYHSNTENNVYLTKTVFDNITPKNSTPPPNFGLTTQV